MSADGMLGQAWLGRLEASGADFDQILYPALDLTKPESVTEQVSEGYELVINCAAWTDVDGAETREDEALAVNGRGVGLLADRCEQIGALLVHYSTDYVFDGKGTTPYLPAHPRDPINAYGRSKAEGEVRLERSGVRSLLLRTSWLYAPWGQNFVRTMLRLVRERAELKVVDDQRGRPSSAEHLAAASQALIESGSSGVFHVTDGGQCSWYELASHIAQQVGATTEIRPCSSDEFPLPAPRPAYSVLDLAATEAKLGPMPAWQDNVDRVLSQLDRGRS